MPNSSLEIADRMLADAEAVCGRLGLQPLRPKQVEVLRHLAERTSTFAALPTGYGKSLCFWMPALAWGWKVWVISPLISLIEDQGMACEALGIKSIAWHGGLSSGQREELEAKMLNGDWQVCFLSPERFQLWEENGCLKAFASHGVDADLLVLDEMHCLEEWRSFRAGYRELAAPLRRCLARGALLLGLSASLSQVESLAWMEELCESHASVSAGLGRENLSLWVVPLESEAERWLLVISALRGLRAPESVLIYCHSREESDDLARWLRSAGIATVAYHAGLPAEERSERSRGFRRGRLRVICATSAFGMGIDYPHVSMVIHFSMPHNLESYWQEVGRAGRAGQEARAIAFWRRSEIARARHHDEKSRVNFFHLWEAWASSRCRKVVVAERLGLEQKNCGKCDRCAETGLAVFGEALFPAWWTQPEACLAEWVDAHRVSSLEVKKCLDTDSESSS